MDYELDFSEDGLVVLTIRGVPTVRELIAVLDAAATDPRYRLEIAWLVDLTGADFSNYSADHMRALAAYNDANKDRLGDGPTALVVADPVDFGVARMYEALANERGVPRRVFTSEDEARAWLAETTRRA